MIAPVDSDLPLFAAAIVRERCAVGSISARPEQRGAEILAFPITRHRTKVETLARRMARYDPNRARFFLRQEAEKSAHKRIAAGIPAEITVAGIAELERAVWARMTALVRQGGDAA